MAGVHQNNDAKLAGSSRARGSSNNNTNDEHERKRAVLESHGYILGRTIGVGTYATVRLAKSKRHGKPVAVKIISKFQAPSANLSTFLPREIEVIKWLRHPNLIRFYQALESSHRVYIIMEYAENGSLLDIIRRDNFIDEDRSRRWFRQLLEALDYCHSKGVVHRDVKCENVLMDRYYNLKLSDFGFARSQMKPWNGIAPLCDTFCGSYAYVPPEIIRAIPYQPQLSDVWSAGVVLYTMVFGRLPFDESNWAKLLKQVTSKIAFPKDPRVSEGCRALILKILVPQSMRPKISEIKTDEWFRINTVSAHTSCSDMTSKSEQSREASTSEISQNSKRAEPSVIVPNNDVTLDNEIVDPTQRQ